MAGEKSQNVQDVFLNHIRKNKMPVTIFLVNGVKLQGIVTWFDNFSVLLRRDAHSQLVYKHAISTIMPAGPLVLFEGNKDGEGGWAPSSAFNLAQIRGGFYPARRDRPRNPRRSGRDAPPPPR